MDTTISNEKKVLIVEDEGIVARNLRMIVENLGYIVCGIASSGAGAINILTDTGCAPELVLMDITLQGDMDGIETAELIREKYHSSILYITGSKDRSTIERALNMTTPNGVILKPFSAEMIKAVITKTLGDYTTPVPGKPSGIIGEERRGSERLFLNKETEAVIHMQGQDIETHALLKDLSATGIGVAANRVLSVGENFSITIFLDSPWKRVYCIGTIVHRTERRKHFHYGIELSLNAENLAILNEYYDFLKDKGLPLN